jgi:chromate transport protein ChrA
MSETIQDRQNSNPQFSPSHGVSLGEAFRVWLRVAALSFGGPAGQIAVMHRVLVEEKRWISESRFLHALNYCMLLPGPEAQQLATYVGWLMHRTRGGLMAGGLFILPGIIAIMGLSWIYALYGKIGFVAALFFGLKAAVLAIVLEAVVRIGKRALKNPVLIGIAAAALVTFGGAYAVLAYVAQQAVETYGWLNPGEMLDGLGMAETTPGPLIMVLQFVGFMAAFRDAGAFPPLLAGTLGGLLATWVTFAPCFLWIFLGAPYIEVLRGNRSLSGALTAITAAVVGVILNLAIWFGIHTIFRDVRPVEWGVLNFDAPVWESVNLWALLLSAAAIVAMFRFKVGMIPTLVACSGAGVLLYLAGAIT